MEGWMWSLPPSNPCGVSPPLPHPCPRTTSRVPSGFIMNASSPARQDRERRPPWRWPLVVLGPPKLLQDPTPATFSSPSAAFLHTTISDNKCRALMPRVMPGGVREGLEARKAEIIGLSRQRQAGSRPFEPSNDSLYPRNAYELMVSLVVEQPPVGPAWHGGLGLWLLPARDRRPTKYMTCPFPEHARAVHTLGAFGLGWEGWGSLACVKVIVGGGRGRALPTAVFLQICANILVIDSVNLLPAGPAARSARQGGGRKRGR